MTGTQTKRRPAVLAVGRRTVRWVTLIEMIVAVGLLLVILGVTFAQVIARFVFDSPFIWTDELARYSYVWLTFIAAAAVMSQRGHITVEVGDQKLPRMVKTVMNIVGMLVVVVVCSMLTVGSVDFLENRAGGTSTALGIPMAMFYGIVYAGLILIGIHALINIFLLIEEAIVGDDTLKAATATRPEESL